MIKSNNICKKISYSQKWDAQFCCSSLSFVIPLFHPVSVSFSLFPSLCLSSFLIFFVFCNEVLDSIFVVYSVASCIAESNLRVPRRHFDSAPPCLPLFQDSKKKEKNRLGSIWPSFLPLPSPPPSLGSIWYGCNNVTSHHGNRQEITFCLSHSASTTRLDLYPLPRLPFAQRFG